MLALQDLAFAAGTGYTAINILVVDFYIRYDELKIAPMKWLSWISYARYALQGLAYNEYHGRSFKTASSIVTGLPGRLPETSQISIMSDTEGMQQHVVQVVGQLIS